MSSLTEHSTSIQRSHIPSEELQDAEETKDFLLFSIYKAKSLIKIAQDKKETIEFINRKRIFDGKIRKYTDR